MAMGPKNACSYTDLAMGIIDQKAMSGNIKPNLWWRYRDDIFDLWTMGHAKLLEFTQFINSLYPTIKFTLVYSPTSLDVLDLTLYIFKLSFKQPYSKIRCEGNNCAIVSRSGYI